jgi:hypothetical protein
MKTIQVFSESEELIISSTKKMLGSYGGMEDTRVIEDTLESLQMLARSISNYPSLLDQQILGKHSRTLDTLVDNLCSHSGLNLLLNTPTKAILGRGFTIAKMNFFILISYICADYLHLCSGKDNIRKVISLNVFSIMAEEVFISIISDDTIEITLREKAGLLLARIWEYRIYRGIEELEPILTDLWISRHSFKPAFGTMQGITEITTFCADRNVMWLNFLEDNDFNEDTLDALREYLMGLSYEEMTKIEDYMQLESISSFNIADVEKVIENTKSYPMIDYHDPREMYHFYARRKNNAIFRKKSCMRGPKRTIEEYIICYMLKHGMIKTNGS